MNENKLLRLFDSTSSSLDFRFFSFSSSTANRSELNWIEINKATKQNKKIATHKQHAETTATKTYRMQYNYYVRITFPEWLLFCCASCCVDVSVSERGSHIACTNTLIIFWPFIPFGSLPVKLFTVHCFHCAISGSI